MNLINHLQEALVGKLIELREIHYSKVDGNVIAYEIASETFIRKHYPVSIQEIKTVKKSIIKIDVEYHKLDDEQYFNITILNTDGKPEIVSIRVYDNNVVFHNAPGLGIPSIKFIAHFKYNDDKVLQIPLTANSCSDAESEVAELLTSREYIIEDIASATIERNFYKKFDLDALKSSMDDSMQMVENYCDSLK